MDGPFTLKNKVAIITGGASGIGESISRIFAMAGANVQILDKDGSSANKLKIEISDNGGKAGSYHCDVSKQPEVIKIYNDIIAKEGSIDIVVCNAGVAQIGTLEQTTVADLDKIYEVNIKGVYNAMYGAINQMKKQGGGVILNMASVAAVVGIPDRFGYSMSKGAVLNMTYTVAKDYVQYNIRCNSISPARIHTPFVDAYLAANYPDNQKEMFDQLAKTQPIGRMGTPDEIGYLALYLCSDKATFITGTNFPIDGGFIKLNT